MTPLPNDLTQVLSAVLGDSSTGWSRWGLAWARVSPLLLIVPAFGLRAVPPPMRIALGLSLGLAVAPAIEPSLPQGPWAAQLAAEFVRGLPVAIVAAISLWVATMAGGLVDDLRGSRQTAPLPIVEPSSTPFGALLTLLVAIAFLQGGGAAQAVAALRSAEPVHLDAAVTLVRTLAAGVGVAAAVAAPLVAVSIVIEVASALIARAASPAFLQPTLAPLRSMAILAAATLLLERMAEFIVLLPHASVP